MRGAIGNAHFAASRFDQAIESYSAAANVCLDLIAARDDPKDVLGLAKATHNIGHATSQLGDRQGASHFWPKHFSSQNHCWSPTATSRNTCSRFPICTATPAASLDSSWVTGRSRWSCTKRVLHCGNVWCCWRQTNIATKTRLAGGYNNVGLALYQAKRVDEAASRLRRAAEIREALIAENPAIPQYAKELGDTYTNLGTFSVKQGRPEDAVHYYEKSVTTFVRLAERTPRSSVIRNTRSMRCRASPAAIQPRRGRSSRSKR